MSLEDHFSKALFEHYQRGRGFPVFKGTDQYGRGLGDILKSIARFVLPIFAPAASRFITSAAGGLNEGRSLKDSAKEALKPALGEALNATTSGIMSRFSGRGLKRKRSTRKRKAPAKRVYKGAGKRTARKFKALGKRRSTKKANSFINF